MTIEKKEKKSYLYTGFIFLFSGILLLFYLVKARGPVGDFITVFSKLFSVIVVIYGIIYLVRYNKFYQENDVKFVIKDNTLFFDDKEYSLKNKYLTLQFNQSPNKELFNVTLNLEEDKKSQTIFKDLVFSLYEMEEFLKLIKPYRKNDTCLLEDDPYKIKLFEDGFSFENREILYKEIQSFKTKLIDVSGALYLDIEIALKNNTKIEKRLTNGYTEYARAIYAKKLFEANSKEIPPIVCPKDGILGTLLAIIAPLTIFLLYIFDDSMLPFAILVFVLVIFYAFFNNISEKKICKELLKIETDEKIKKEYKSLNC